MLLLTYLLTDEFLVDKVYGSFTENTSELKFLLEGLECYRPKDTQMKACDITKLTSELKSSKN